VDDSCAGSDLKGVLDLGAIGLSGTAGETFVSSHSSFGGACHREVEEPISKGVVGLSSAEEKHFFLPTSLAALPLTAASGESQMAPDWSSKSHLETGAY